MNQYLMKKFTKTFRLKKKYGNKYLFSYIANLILQRFGLFTGAQLFKEKISKDAEYIFGKTIKYGPFKGMKLSSNIWWGKYDILSKYLGQYEPHILEKLISNSKNNTHFIDIGAADGYYAIGLLFSNLFKTATCFEVSKNGRSVISENAHINFVQKRLTILGKADQDLISQEIMNFPQSVILCDIEGAEFDLFSEDLLKTCKSCVVIIELHDEFTKGKSNRRENLIKLASKFFKVNLIKRSNPKINNFEEIKDWSDDLRLLAFSENRPIRMDWLLLTPKKSNKISKN